MRDRLLEEDWGILIDVWSSEYLANWHCAIERGECRRVEDSLLRDCLLRNHLSLLNWCNSVADLGGVGLDLLSVSTSGMIVVVAATLITSSGSGMCGLLVAATV